MKWEGIERVAFSRISVLKSPTFILGLMVCTLVSGCSTTPLKITEIVPGVFDGRKPRSKADFDALHANGIRTIVSLQTMAWDIAPERKLATEHGIAFTNVAIVASPFGPTQQKVQQLFQALAASSLQPVYVHCLLGRDRTGVLMALYKVYYQNADPKAAWAEMIRGGGFRSRWALIGFRIYYWHHSEKPAWVANGALGHAGNAAVASTQSKNCTAE